jgi:hypothetical protein
MMRPMMRCGVAEWNHVKCGLQAAAAKKAENPSTRKCKGDMEPAPQVLLLAAL